MLASLRLSMIAGDACSRAQVSLTSAESSVYPRVPRHWRGLESLGSTSVLPGGRVVAQQPCGGPQRRSSSRAGGTAGGIAEVDATVAGDIRRSSVVKKAEEDTSASVAKFSTAALRIDAQQSAFQASGEDRAGGIPGVAPAQRAAACRQKVSTPCRWRPGHCRAARGRTGIDAALAQPAAVSSGAVQLAPGQTTQPSSGVSTRFRGPRSSAPRRPGHPRRAGRWLVFQGDETASQQGGRLFLYFFLRFPCSDCRTEGRCELFYAHRQTA